MSTPEQLTALRRERDQALSSAIAAGRRATEAETALAEATRSHGQGQDERVAALRRQVDAAREDADGARRNHDRLQGDAAAGLRDWLRQGPEQVVARLSDQDPFLLFPVRLETKFGRTATGGAELRVRIWPDDICVAIPPGDLTASERKAGEQYWDARALVATSPAGAAAEAARLAHEGAWLGIASEYGAYRTGWITGQTKPTNWNDASNAPLALPLVRPVAVPSSEPRLARARALPDRFVIHGSYQGQSLPDVVGNGIPDDLALAPDPSHGKNWIDRDAAGNLVVDEPWRWMVDFDAAVAVGMGVRVPLQPPWDSTGFDLLMAIGVRGVAGPADGVATVESLLAAHRFDDGCAIVRNGTPTNNTDAVLSGWRPPSTEAEQLLSIDHQPPSIAVTAGPLGEVDGMRLVRLLGLGEAFVRRLPNATATDLAEALAMNRAASFATIFEFTKEFLDPLVGASTRDALRSFFHRHVSGRGTLPALRVGRQPYGIVVTSDWQAWTAETPTHGTSIEQQLVTLLRAHRPAWAKLVGGVPTGNQASNPFARLMLIVGQLASSAQYLSRTTVTDDYAIEQLKFATGASRQSQIDWLQELGRQRRASLDKILPVAAEQWKALLSSLLFTERTDAWTAPIIDRDPRVPLSERDPVAPFFGTTNYLRWLATASLPALTGEHFTGANGATLAAPSALLYVLLRYALLTAVEEGSLAVASIAGERLFDVIARDPLVANIGQSQQILRRDYLGIDAASLGVADVSVPLSKWVHDSARLAAVGGQWATVLAVVTDANAAIAALADVPTARLERLLAEHIDLCSYRIDAWISALYAERLEQMRQSQQLPGLHVGAYGWVEHLHPDWTDRTPVASDALPPSLQGSVTGPVYESADNGGFVHAPSLSQAATSAVLRNAYLSHASPAQPDLFSVNLSSARVRVAQTFIEGIRNGQPLAALLGYELERGLHERHPGIEVDQYRYVLRDRFPLLAGKLTDLKVGVNAEVVEARNVVHGLDLLEHTAARPYPYDIVGLPAGGSAEAAVIVSEIDRLRASLDAVSDLLLAESVHQAVQGNMERTKASLQALTEPESAPEPEVVRTPRSSRLLTFRVALALDAGSTKQWPGTLTPRAAANPAVNAWLAQHLPAPADIQWSVVNGAAAAARGSVAELGIQPLDMVLLAGEQLGELSSELERLIVHVFRTANKVADDVRTRARPLSGPPDAVAPLVFDFSASAPLKHALAQLHPLLLRLRRLVSRSRATHALDWLPSTEGKRADPADPTGSASNDPKLIKLKELNDRLDAGVTGLKGAKAGVEAALAALAPLQAPVDALKQALVVAHGYGMPEALPAEGQTLSPELMQTLGTQAAVVVALIARRLATVEQLRKVDADPLPPDDPERTLEVARRIVLALEGATAAARQLFGNAFVIVPLFQFHQPEQLGELSLAAATPIADPFAVEEWLHSAARVRPALADVTWAMAVAAWLQVPIADPVVVQLPRLAGAPWIGGTFSAPLAEGEWLAIVALRGGASLAGLQCGLVIDEWTEDIPADKSTTGVAFHFNRPNATAPQALLLAVPPVRSGQWTWDALKGSVREAFDLAQLRSIEPDTLISGGYFQGLPAVLSEFTVSRLASTNLTERSLRSIDHLLP